MVPGVIVDTAGFESAFLFLARAQLAYDPFAGSVLALRTPLNPLSTVRQRVRCEQRVHENLHWGKPQDSLGSEGFSNGVWPETVVAKG
jgi:hypothetical protein